MHKINKKMGECLSICQRDEYEGNEDDNKNNNKGNICPERTKKNKTRIPKGIISDDSEDEDIPITKCVSNTIDNDIPKTKSFLDQKEDEIVKINEKIRKAKKNWEKLIDKLIQNRIDILREIVKKEKAENKSESSDSEEDEKLEDIKKENEEKIKNNKKGKKSVVFNKEDKLFKFNSKNEME